jgi:hypothetical protein
MRALKFMVCLRLLIAKASWKNPVPRGNHAPHYDENDSYYQVVFHPFREIFMAYPSAGPRSAAGMGFSAHPGLT